MRKPHYDTAFTDNLTAVAGYAHEHGHACPPNDAVWNGLPVGLIMKNARTAQRRTENLQRRAEAGERGLDWTGALPAERKAAFDAIHPAWCPTSWTLEWQRHFTLARHHVQAGGVLLGAEPGSITVQGEDLAEWARTQQLRWDKLGPHSSGCANTFSPWSLWPPQSAPKTPSATPRKNIATSPPPRNTGHEKATSTFPEGTAKTSS